MFKNIFKAVLFFAAVVTSGLAAAAPVGYVHAVKGVVTLRDAGKQPAPAKTGDTFEQGANFTTSANGEITLKFEDGQVAMLSPNTVFIATTYVYNKAKVADGNIVFNLLRGGLRFVSGVMAETSPAKFAVRTPTATAGVRGSGGVMEVSQDGQRVTAVTTKGILTLTVGNNPPIVLPLGQFTSSANGAPGIPAQAATQIINTPGLAGVALLITALAAAPAPPNNPVAVAATALAIQTAVLAAADPTNVTLQQAAAAALTDAVAANQGAIAAAVAGGAVAGAGADTGGAAPPVTIIDTTVPTAPVNQPATTTSTG